MTTTAFQVGPDEEKDIVPVEDLLMQLGMVQAVFEQLTSYAAAVEMNDGCPGNLIAPDQWAVAGAIQALNKVSFALKAGCFGHEAAHIH